jgi:hypothetical protein
VEILMTQWPLDPDARPALFRTDGWDIRLATLIAAEQATPFSWGRHDCATLAVAAVLAVAGGDLAHGVAPWFSPHSAARALRLAGAETAEAFFAARLPAIDPAAARRGDLVYADGPVDALGCPAVLTGAEAQSRNEAGWVVFPRTLVARAYRVG